MKSFFLRLFEKTISGHHGVILHKVVSLIMTEAQQRYVMTISYLIL